MADGRVTIAREQVQTRGGVASPLVLQPFRNWISRVRISSGSGRALVGGVDCVGGFEQGLDVGRDGLQAHEGFLDFGA